MIPIRLIWRIYSLKTRTDIDTVFYGEDTIPAWSIKGNFLAYAKDNIIKIVSAKTKKDIKTSTQGIKNKMNRTTTLANIFIIKI